MADIGSSEEYAPGGGRDGGAKNLARLLQLTPSAERGAGGFRTAQIRDRPPGLPTGFPFLFQGDGDQGKFGLNSFKRKTPSKSALMGTTSKKIFFLALKGACWLCLGGPGCSPPRFHFPRDAGPRDKF